MGGLSKKAEAGLVIILVVIIVLFFFGWLINIGQRECKSNKDCGSEAYCGSDFACHTYPTIQKTVVQYNLFWPALIIGIAIVIAAVMPRLNSKAKEPERFVEKIFVKEPEEVEEIAEPYYKSKNNNARTP
ncbi:hypothetical protein J4204_03695 [Candidatus Woesearchaeota archaeon]|nr:hypothetical protein [Candidatus Woesearchaeota archaeon]